ncbi:Hypothetical protein CINCED_3A009710 [Cinara cedri]|uniref:Uncharacterized protein n=1 Tax=Cinara cedri TaxID=506608 RepID=A0A5E4MDU7_9HEMI|nr:Hypothetical protein CINCED_3A009710 [Cinara cedri]
MILIYVFVLQYRCARQYKQELGRNRRCPLSLPLRRVNTSAAAAAVDDDVRENGRTAVVVVVVRRTGNRGRDGCDGDWRGPAARVAGPAAVRRAALPRVVQASVGFSGSDRGDVPRRADPGTLRERRPDAVSSAPALRGTYANASAAVLHDGTLGSRQTVFLHHGTRRGERSAALYGAPFRTASAVSRRPPCGRDVSAAARDAVLYGNGSISRRRSPRGRDFSAAVRGGMFEN